VFRIVYAGVFPISHDEAYYWEWSRHLALGYYDHPPLTAWIIRLTTLLLGPTTLGVRLGAIGLMTGASVVVFRLGHRLSGRTDVGCWAGLLVQLIPLTSFGFIFMSPDAGSIFFWALCLWLLQRAVFEQRTGSWYAFGFTLGLGLMTKFTNVLLIPGAVLFLVLCPGKRYWFRRKEPYFAGLVSLLTITPFLYWEATHEWATFVFQLHARHLARSGGADTVLDYIGVQLAVISPLLFVALLLAVIHAWRKGAGRNNDRMLYLACFSSVPFTFFLLASLRGPIRASWPVPGYLGACVVLSWMALEGRPYWVARLWKPSVATAIGFLGFFYVAVGLWGFLPEVVAPLALRVGVRPHQMYWWMGNREVVQALEERSGEDRTLLVSSDYSVCAVLAFNSPSKVACHLLPERGVRGLSYRYWRDELKPYLGRNAFWVHDRPPDETVLEELRESFDTVGPMESFPIIRRGRRLRTFSIVPCRNLLQPPG
jgi:4-amino-4-deoxy-L-arabinose transferase-like glycosyltransferase